MALLRATVTLNRFTEIPEDAINNVLHFRVDSGDVQAAASAIEDDIQNFYQGIQAYLSPALSPNALAHRVDFAEVTMGSPGATDDTVSPVFDTHEFTLATVGSTTSAFPAEVAVCLSLRGAGAEAVPEETGSIRPRSRYRGRVYIGPLGRNSALQGSDGECRVWQEFIDVLLAEAQDHLVDDAAAAGANWCVYSRANASAPTIDRLHVDNAFDTVRSRGEKASSRTVVAVGP